MTNYNAEETLNILREKSPLVLNLTNVVTMDFVANCLLALGAAPIMSQCEDELEALVTLSSVIYINVGTLDHAYIARARQAVQYAKQQNKPIVLDPVGAGASQLRTEISHEFAQQAEVVRGNASEILALATTCSISNGVESVHTTENAKPHADALAKAHDNIYIISGKTDYITDGKKFVQTSFGSALMSKVTGMGCALTGCIAALLAVTPPFEACKIAVNYFALCGEQAQKHSDKPGSFKVSFIDTLYAMEPTIIQQIDTL